MIDKIFVGIRVKQFRQLYHVPQHVMSKRLNRSKSWLCKVEKGHLDLSVGMAHAVSQLFGRTLDDFLFGEIKLNKNVDISETDD